jgi:hypothetical protein
VTKIHFADVGPLAKRNGVTLLHYSVSDGKIAPCNPELVMPILYSWLATSLKFLSIILPLQVHKLALTYTFATVFIYLPHIRLCGCTEACVGLHYHDLIRILIRFENGISRVYPYSDMRYVRVNDWVTNILHKLTMRYYRTARSVTHFVIRMSHLRAVKSS